MADDRQHEDEAAIDDEAPMQWREIGTFAPRIPAGPAPAGAADLGPGGSLLEQVRRARAARRAARPRLLSRPCLLIAAGAAAVVVGGLLVVAVGGLAGPLGVLVAVAGVGAAAGGGVVLRDEARTGGELAAQAWRERQLAREADQLSASGWRVLHDRVLPGGHHRVAHVAVGPAGVFVLTPLPAGPLRMVGDPPAPGSDVDGRQLYAGSVHLTPWLRTRRWEIEQLEPALAEAIEDAVWSGPTTPLVVQVPPHGGGQPSSALPDLPADWAGVLFRPLSAVTATLRGLPSPLSPLVVADLAAHVERLCPPAGTAAGQGSSNKLN